MNSGQAGIPQHLGWRPPRRAARRRGQEYKVGTVYRVGYITGATPLSELAGSEPVHLPTSAFPHGLRVVTATIPIVMAAGGDPVGEGIVQSLARSGGNITGLATFVEPELEAKRLEHLRAMLPGVSRVAYLASKEFKDLESSGGR